MRRLAVCLTLFVFLFTLLPSQAPAGEPLTPELTLEMAVERALKTDSSLKKAKKDLERSVEVKDYLADRIDFIPTGPVPSSNAESVFLNLTRRKQPEYGQKKLHGQGGCRGSFRPSGLL